MTRPKLAYEETFDCVQCGYCLPACPTYLTMKKETHSPRGRINLVKMAAEGKITYSDLAGPIELCLGCRACEVVCPTNVQYGRILESAKEVLQHSKEKKSLFATFLFGKVLSNEKWLRSTRMGLAIYQQFGLQTVARKSKLLNLFPDKIKAFESVLPEMNRPLNKGRRENVFPAKGPMYKIGFFSGCMMDSLFSTINTKSMKLLQAAGCEVTVIKEQTCCGALQLHSGKKEMAKQLAKENIIACEAYDFDFIVNSIGGCGAMLVEYEHLLSDDDGDWRKRAKAFSEKNVDISVILSKLNLSYTKDVHKIVTYQPSCHLDNVQKRSEEALQLLKSIPGIHYMELRNKEMCCGSAGIYNLINYEASMDILDDKMGNVQRLARNPDVIVTTNPGCYLQMKLGLHREGLSEKINVIHLVEIVAEACGITD
ncbi:(Fe-S)-binding protein [Oceanobacillus senegalensis]|uniref:(Fe-S)-binding protein n=1 Tax=Oceanobacillus senegalensis TaxID=1936063 RepID=UPI000A304E5C|nr:(Fe-S)-binding protein [Oceanobacillus senegalensis]